MNAIVIGILLAFTNGHLGDSQVYEMKPGTTVAACQTAGDKAVAELNQKYASQGVAFWAECIQMNAPTNGVKTGLVPSTNEHN